MCLQKTFAISATAGLILVLILLMPGNSCAKVTGACANCHTMHNSQNGTAMVAGGGGSGGCFVCHTEKN